VQNVARAACDAFIAKGYRRTLMTDVGERLNLSHALLYQYVEGKEALLELAARYAMDQDADLEALVPLPNPPKGQVLELVRDWLATRATFPKLRAAVERGPGGDAAEELAGVIDELYDFLEQNRLLLLLVESLVDDYPGLTGASVDDRKRSFKGLMAAFLASGATLGALRPLSNPEVAAHFLVESVAWFAQHRKRDPNAAMIDDREARSSLRDLLLAAFLPATTTTGRGR